MLERGVKQQFFYFHDIVEGETGQVQLRDGSVRLLQVHDFGQIADHARSANECLDPDLLEAWQGSLELGRHSLFEPFQRVGGRLFLQIQVVEPDRAELQAGRMKQLGPVAHDQLDGPAADIHDQHVAVSEIHAVPNAQVDQTGLFLPRDHADTDARFPLDGLDQVAAVGRFADGAGSDRLDPRVHAGDRKSTRLNSSHSQISYAVFCLKKKKK